jgi:hypothetical protein
MLADVVVDSGIFFECRIREDVFDFIFGEKSCVAA